MRKILVINHKKQLCLVSLISGRNFLNTKITDKNCHIAYLNNYVETSNDKNEQQLPTAL